MMRFFLKGILRDKGRSYLPITVIVIGVTLTVVLSGYIRGVMADVVDQNARFETGHLKIMTKSYAENKDQLPNDLALLGVDTLVTSLEHKYPDVEWVQRITFGGLIDIPNELGETVKQGPISGMAIELFSKKSKEIDRMNIAKSMVTGTIPQAKGDAMISHDLAEKLKLKVGDKFTYFGSTMNGSMAFFNFKISGTIRFGSSLLDRGAMIIDISDAQQVLDMNNGTSGLLGYFSDRVYIDKKAEEISKNFNAQYINSNDEFAPVMLRLKEQNNLATYLDQIDVYSNMFVIIFIIAMSVVLWNTGLLGGLRRFKEFGIRLALGESKGRIYTSLLLEAIFIGAIGSFIGTFLGIAITLYLQKYGIDISKYLTKSTMMMPSVMRSKFSIDLLFIGFIPGLLAIFLGNLLSGKGIYKRETAQLFNELEV